MEPATLPEELWTGDGGFVLEGVAPRKVAHAPPVDASTSRRI